MTRVLSPKLRYSFAVAALALVAMVVAAVVTDGPTFLSAQTAEPSVVEQADTTVAAEVEIQRRFNELRSELLDDRSDTVEWWLTATAIFVTLFGVGIAVLGYIGFNRFRQVEAEAGQSVEQAARSAEEARRHLKAIEAVRERSDQILQSLREATSEDIQDPDKAKRIGPAVQDVQRNPEASPLDRAIADAYSLQLEGKFQEAIEKWRALANIAEGVDRHLAARAWFSVGFLLHRGEEAEFLEPNVWETVDAYSKAIAFKSDYSEAYNNRGVAKLALGQYDEAIADYDQAIGLRPDDAEVYSNRSEARVALRQYREAIEDCDKAIRLKPKLADSYSNRGAARAALGDFEGARSDFETGLNLANEAGKEGLKAMIEQQLQELDGAEGE